MPTPSQVHMRSDQSSWKRLCRMPKVVSSARAMVISAWSGEVVTGSQTKKRCLEWAMVAMKRGNGANAARISTRGRPKRHQ